MTARSQAQERQQEEGALEEQSLIEDLNEALAYEYQAVIMYNTYAATVRGMDRAALAEEFHGETQDELGHARFLAEKIDALGGTPTTEAKDVPGASDPREMLERVLQAEEDAIQRYTDLAEKAEAFGDRGLAIRLDDLIADETEHKEATEKLLGTR